MFDCGITANNLIKGLKDEIDVALEIPDETYFVWLNSFEQLLYSDIIHEQNKITLRMSEELNFASDAVITLSALYVPPETDRIKFEDICAVFADRTQLLLSDIQHGELFPNTYYKINNNLGYNTAFDGQYDKIIPNEVTIFYYVRPAIKKKTDTNAAVTGVRMPLEFTELMRARLRGEAYKLCNEDGTAAKWFADYNTLLENFKIWIHQRTAVLD